MVNVPYSEMLGTLELAEVMKEGGHSEEEREKLMYGVGHTPRLWYENDAGQPWLVWLSG